LDLPKTTLAVSITADLSKPGGSDTLPRQAIEAMGHIDVLFNNAGKLLEAVRRPPGEVWLERQGKWFSTAAIIFPKYIERSLNALKDRPVQKEMPQKRRWRLLQIEPAIACNLDCVMCPWREIAKNVENRGLMSQEIWESIRPHLSDIISILHEIEKNN
jgi:hypothetical protein